MFYLWYLLYLIILFLESLFLLNFLKIIIRKINYVFYFLKNNFKFFFYFYYNIFYEL